MRGKPTGGAFSVPAGAMQPTFDGGFAGGIYFIRLETLLYKTLWDV